MKKLVVIGICAHVVGCGDPLTDAAYRGEALFSVRGQVVSFVDVGPAVEEDTLRASLFWNRQTEPNAQLDLLEQSSVATGVSFPSTFEIHIFNPPEPQHFTQAGRAYAQGLILIYADTNRSGRYEEANDTMIGASTSKGLIFAERALATSGAGTAFAPRGFSLVDLPIPCALFDDVEVFAPDPAAQSCSANVSCPANFTCDLVTSQCVESTPVELIIHPDVPSEIADLGCL